MASILKILRRIGGAKGAPVNGQAGELAIWKAGTAPSDATVLYVHDGIRFVSVVDNDANLTLAKPGAGTAGRLPTADAAGAVSWTLPTNYASANITVTGSSSISGGGDLTANRTLALVGDVVAPGSNFYYGTNAAGLKGFHAFPLPYTLPAATATVLGGIKFGTPATGQFLNGFAADGTAQWAAAGDVVGPAASTDNAIARFDTATGKLIQNSGVTISDLNDIAGARNIAVGGNANGAVAATTGVMDLNAAQVFTAAAGAMTYSFANVPAGRATTVVLHKTNGGAATQTWPTSVKWPGGTAPSLSAAGIDVLVFTTHDGGTTWRGNIFGKDIK